MKFTDKVNDLMKKPKTIEGNLDEVKISKNYQKGINGLDEKISYSNDNFINEIEKKGIDVVEEKRGILESINNSKIYEKYDKINQFKDISNDKMREVINKEIENVEFEIKEVNGSMSLGKLAKYAKIQRKHHQSLELSNLYKSKKINCEIIKKYGNY